MAGQFVVQQCDRKSWCMSLVIIKLIGAKNIALDEDSGAKGLYEQKEGKEVIQLSKQAITYYWEVWE